MANIRFNYLYRDGSNYKSWGDVIFSNPEGITANEVEARLINAFLPDKQFIAHQISIPEKFLFLTEKITNYDHCYHEFDSVEVCNEDTNDRLGRSISDFLQEVEIISEQEWKAFDILNRFS